MMDLSKEYRKMCGLATSLQDYFWENYWALLPSYVYDRGLERSSITIWTPKTLSERLNVKAEGDQYIIVSIEQSNDGNIHLPHIEQLYGKTVIWLPTVRQIIGLREDSHEVIEILEECAKVSKLIAILGDDSFSKSPEKTFLTYYMYVAESVVWRDGLWEMP